MERSLTGAGETCEEEAAAEKLWTDHNHPFPIHTALFGREEVGVAGKKGRKKGRSDGKPGKKSGVEHSVVVICLHFSFPKPVLFGNK